MMILHNLSFETDCCDCCKNDQSARIPQPVMDSINNGLRQKIRSQTLYQKGKRKERYGYINNGLRQKIRSQTLYQKGKRKERYGYV